jgi:hypothetical protein
MNLRGKLKQVCQKTKNWLLAHHLLPSIFWACLVYIGHHTAPLVFDAPDQLAYTFIQNVMADQTQKIVPKKGLVALISDKTFYGAPYYGEEPTQRCAVLDSLQKIVVHEPNALVVDINLSPTYRDLLHPSRAVDATNCQSRLEQFLITTASTRPLLLIDPMQFPVDSAATLESRLTWRQSMEAKGIYFGHADILHGILSPLTQFAPSATRDKGTPHSENKIESGMSYRLCQLMACNKDLEHELPLTKNKRLINYAAFANFFDSKFTEEIQPDDIKNKIVYFGFGVQGQDQRATPIGEAYGVQVHAAYYATMQQPIKTNGFVDILGDVLIGMLVAFWGSKLLERFIAKKKEESKNSEKIWWGRFHVRYAYLNVVLLVLSAIIGSTIVISISYLLLSSSFRVWTSPLVMIFAMCLDLFCRIPFERLSPHAALHTPNIIQSSSCIFKRICTLSQQFNTFFINCLNWIFPLSVRKRVGTFIWHCIAWGVPLYSFYQLLNSHH